MRVLLMHNPKAGVGKVTKRQLLSLLKEEGHDVVYDDNYKSKLSRKLRTPADVVIAAGGDGTIANVARAIMGLDLPMIGIPLGTANNVAQGLQMNGELSELAATLRDPHEERMDMGLATGSWGERYFVESAGVGLFSHALDEHLSSEDKEPSRSAGVLRRLLDKYRPRSWEVALDGQEITGRFVLIDCMNVPMMGPNLCLSPSASPFDGMLDVVMITEDDRDAFAHYLTALSEKKKPPLPKLTVKQAKHVQIKLTDHALRIDDRVRPRVGDKPSHFADLRVLPGAVRVWVPKPKAG